MSDIQSGSGQVPQITQPVQQPAMTSNMGDIAPQNSGNLTSASPILHLGLDSRSLLSSFDDFDQVDNKEINEYLSRLSPGLQECIEQSMQAKKSIKLQIEAIENIILNWNITRDAETSVEALGICLCLTLKHFFDDSVEECRLPVKRGVGFSSKLVDKDGECQKIIEGHPILFLIDNLK